MPPVVRILGSGGYPLLDDNPCAAPQIGRVDDLRQRHHTQPGPGCPAVSRRQRASTGTLVRDGHRVRPTVARSRCLQRDRQRRAGTGLSGRTIRANAVRGRV